MGGCQSTSARIGETAGAFALAGVSAVAGAPALAGLAGGVGFGFALGGKRGCDKSPTALVKATNEIIATAIVQSSNKCNQQADITQLIDIRCLPTNLDGIQVWEQNAGCRLCFESVFEGMLAHHALERKLWNEGQEVKVRLPINDEYGLMLQRLELCGIGQCKACALQNVTQANLLKANSSCYEQLRSTANFSANLRALIKEQLLNNQDVLSGLADALGQNGLDSITDTVSSRLETQVTTSFLTSVTSLMEQSQVIQIRSNSTVDTNNISQENAYNIALQEVTNSNVTLNAISTDVFDAVARVANQQNTLNDVGEAVFQSTLDITQALEGVVARVMFAVLSVLVVTVLVIVGYLIYKVIRRAVKAAHRQEKLYQLKQTQKPLLQQL